MKVGRNDPCPCGSGKKFKKCCIDKPEYNQVTALWDNSSSSQSQAADSKAVKKTSRFEILSESMEAGLQLLESEDDEGAASKWLEGWVWLLEYAEEQGLTSLESVDAHMRGEFTDTVSNWVQDLEACVGNLAMHDEDWGMVRIRLIRDLLNTFPDTDPEIVFTMRESEAETLFVLGRMEEGDARFADLVRDFPQNAWSYMGWGDMYSPAFFQNRWPKDPSRAREIYEHGLGPQVTADRQEIEERIRLLGDEASFE